MSHFKVLGGDLPKTTTLVSMLGTFQLVAPRSGFTFKSDSYELKNNIAMIEQITEKNKAQVLSKAGWSTLGAIALGPVGLLAGLLFSGNTKYICMAVKLKSGQEFLAECDLKTYQKFYSTYIESNPCKTTPPEEEKANTTADTKAGSPAESEPSVSYEIQDPSALLQQLKVLKDEGIITEEEYRAKARKIFDSIG